MGLDIYITEHTNHAAADAYARRKETAHEEIWKRIGEGASYSDMAESTRRRASKACDAWDREHPPTAEEHEARYLELASERYPDHPFKIGKLYSSYNASGLNNLLRRSIGRDLYFVFFGDSTERPDCSFPKWGDVLRRAVDVRDMFARHCEAFGAYDVHRVAPNMFRPIEASPNEEMAAFAIFKQELSRHRAHAHEPRPEWDSGNYSNVNGLFNLGEPERVVAVIPGWEESIGAKLQGRSGEAWPCVYVVHETTRKEGERYHEWYQQGLEIVVEMCEWLLAQPHPEHFRMVWSA